MQLAPHQIISKAECTDAGFFVCSNSFTGSALLHCALSSRSPIHLSVLKVCTGRILAAGLGISNSKCVSCLHLLRSNDGMCSCFACVRASGARTLMEPLSITAHAQYFHSQFSSHFAARSLVRTMLVYKVSPDVSSRFQMSSTRTVQTVYDCGGLLHRR